MSSKLTELMSRRRQIARHIEALTQELQSIDDQLMARLGKLAEALEGADASPPGHINEGRSKQPHFQFSNYFGESLSTVVGNSSTRNEREPGLVERIEEVIRSSGRPLRTRELFELLQERKVVIGGKNPMNNLAAHLSYSKKFVRAPEGWTLKQGDMIKSGNANAPKVQ